MPSYGLPDEAQPVDCRGWRSHVDGSRGHPRMQIQVTCTHRDLFRALRSPAHASDGHMYTPARPTVTCTHRCGHLRTQVTVTCTHHFSGDGVGWGDNVHVSVHTQAQQIYHLSCCSAYTGTTHPCVPLNYCLYFTSLFKLPPLRSTRLLSPFYFFI